MQNPVREVMRLDGRWVSRRRSRQSAEVFVPDAWAGARILLQQASGESLAVDERIIPGGWNLVQTEGPLAGARLAAAKALQLVAVDASVSGEKSLAVRVRLAESNSRPKALLTIVFTVTAPDGRQVGLQDATVSTRTRDITMDIPLAERARGQFRLKVTLSVDDQVLDNARVDLEL